jgi:ribonuclease HI
MTTFDGVTFESNRVRHVGRGGERPVWRVNVTQATPWTPLTPNGVRHASSGTPRCRPRRPLRRYLRSTTERGTSAGDGSGPKTRYHLLTTDGGIVADQPGKAAGEAAIGVVLKAPLEEISEPIGPAKDHHVAEYRALIRDLAAARSRGIEHLRVCLDSLLVVNQLNRRWAVKAEHLKPLHEQAVSLIQQFADIKITWVPRKANAEADALASTPLGPLRPKPKPSIDELPLD